MHCSGGSRHPSAEVGVGGGGGERDSGEVRGVGFFSVET